MLDTTGHLSVYFLECERRGLFTCWSCDLPGSMQRGHFSTAFHPFDTLAWHSSQFAILDPSSPTPKVISLQTLCRWKSFILHQTHACKISESGQLGLADRSASTRRDRRWSQCYSYHRCISVVQEPTVISLSLPTGKPTVRTSSYCSRPTWNGCFSLSHTTSPTLAHTHPVATVPR